MGAGPSRQEVTRRRRQVLNRYAAKFSGVVWGRGREAFVEGAGPEGLKWSLSLDFLQASNGEAFLMPQLHVFAPDRMPRTFRDHALDPVACVNCVLAELHGARVWALIEWGARPPLGSEVTAGVQAVRLFADLDEAVLVQVRGGNRSNLFEALSLAPDLARLLREVPAFEKARSEAWDRVKHRMHELA